ncbi:MAG: SprT-like domain-containing protein [Muribaculum sp.]|nr:SprT-like domain-containing protein [Muribaculum sp.]
MPVTDKSAFTLSIPMRPTLEFLAQRFHHFNHTIFKDRLPEPQFVINRNRSRFGQLRFRVNRSLTGKKSYSDFQLGLSCIFDREISVWEDVVIHEMIHLLIHSNGFTDTSAHGTMFRAVMEKINRVHHRHISISSRLSEAERNSDDVHRCHYICVARLNNGTTGIACMASNRLHLLKDSIEKGFDCKNIEWYSSTHPYFNRFPRIRTPRLFIITDTGALNDALTNSQRLILR